MMHSAVKENKNKEINIKDIKIKEKEGKKKRKRTIEALSYLSFLYFCFLFCFFIFSSRLNIILKRFIRTCRSYRLMLNRLFSFKILNTTASISKKKKTKINQSK